MTDAVRLETLYKTYADTGAAVTALDGVTATFAAGTFTAVMGPSGSGKSTLLQCAAGLDRPTAGRVFLDGAELTAGRDTAMTKFRRSRVGFVFQDYNLLPGADRRAERRPAAAARRPPGRPETLPCRAGAARARRAP